MKKGGAVAVLLLRVIVIFDYVGAPPPIGMHLNPFTEKGDSEIAVDVINTYCVCTEFISAAYIRHVICQRALLSDMRDLGGLIFIDE